MSTKDSNPKQAYGDMKVGLSSIPMAFVYGVALAMAEGGMKYGRHNYREMGCKHSTYFDAAIGHLVSWWEGEDVDEESGLHHLLKAAASIAVVYDSIVMENDNDDRPIRYPAGVPLRINEAIAKLKEKYPDPVEPYTQKRKNQELLDALDKEVENHTWTPPMIKENKLPGTILAGTLMAYNDDGTVVPAKLDAPKKKPTEAEIDSVLSYIFKESDEPDFLIVERKGSSRMTPDIHRLIEKALGMGVHPGINFPPWKWLCPEKPTAHEVKQRAEEAKIVLEELHQDLEDAIHGAIAEVNKNLAKSPAPTRDGYRKGCETCDERHVCREEDSECHCSDCIHFIPAGKVCLKGKFILTDDPQVNDCPYFERETE
jgi:hypothetical protein